MRSDHTEVATDPIIDTLAGLPALLTLRRASEHLGIPVGTLRRWIRAGLLKPMKICGGHPRLARAELARVLREGAS